MEKFLNTVILGDCLEIMPQIEDKSIDMILCDLPYGTTACKWDTIIPFEPLWKEYKRIIKDNGAIVLTASQPFTSALVMSNPDMFKYEWIWDKVKPSTFLNAKRSPLMKHESILMFSNGKFPAYNPVKTKGRWRNKTPNRSEVKREQVYRNLENKNIDNFNDEYYPKSIVAISNATQKGKTPKNCYHKNANLWNNKQRGKKLQQTKSMISWKKKSNPLSPTEVARN